MFCFLSSTWKRLLTYCFLTYIFPSPRKKPSSLRWAHTLPGCVHKGLGVPYTFFFSHYYVECRKGSEPCVRGTQVRWQTEGASGLGAVRFHSGPRPTLFLKWDKPHSAQATLLGVSYYRIFFFFFVLKITGRDRSRFFNWKPVLLEHKLTAGKS